MRHIIQICIVYVAMFFTISDDVHADSAVKPQSLFIDCHEGSFEKSNQKVINFFGTGEELVFGLCKRINGSYDFVILTSDMKKELDRISIISGNPDATLSVESIDGGKFPIKSSFSSKEASEIISPMLVKHNFVSSEKKVKLDLKQRAFYLIFIRHQRWYIRLIH